MYKNANQYICLAPDPLSPREHPPDDREKEYAKSDEHSEGYEWRDIRYSVHRVAESVDHIEDRIGVRHHLPDGWKHRDRVEHSTEIGEWCEDKIRNHRCRVKAISNESVQESDE